MKGFVGSDVLCPHCKDITCVRQIRNLEPPAGYHCMLYCYNCKAEFECPSVPLVQTKPPSDNSICKK